MRERMRENGREREHMYERRVLKEGMRECVYESV
jgi:hypothetical protein